MRREQRYLTMQQIIIFSAFLALAAAAPGYLLTPEVHVPLGKTTVTKSSQVVDHGSTYVHHPVVPVVHTPVVHAPVVHAPLVSVSVPAKSTITKSSQIVDHGSTTLVHAPVVHAPVVHAPLVSVSVPAKSTVTKSSQIVNHGSTTLVHTPVVHTPVVHTPVVHAAPVYVHSSPLVTYKSGDSAVSHHSSTVHETVPLVAVHH